MEKRIEHYADIGYAVEVYGEPDDMFVDFKVFTYYSGSDEPLYQRAGATGSPDPTPDIADAEVFASGHVKWDGCANFRFDSQESCMLHTCTRDDLVAIGTLLGRVHDIAGEMMAKADFKPETTRAEREGKR